MVAMKGFGTRKRGKAVDLFAGGGGMSLGITRAGLDVVLAVNHDAHAIAMHAENHRSTIHLREDVFDVNPIEVCRGKFRRGQLDLLWLSPDCTHHSRAKGGKPVSNKRRGLANVGIEWALAVAPKVIGLENVPEFQEWGPLYPENYKVVKLRNKPIPERRGEMFREFVGKLKLAGYRVDWRVLNAADYGAPTARKRLFLIARREGEIVWPVPSHGPKAARPWRTAAECIDWSIPMLSIFASRAEAKAWAEKTGADGIPKRPLAEATQRRIAEGVRRYVVESKKPFLVNLTHGVRIEDIDEPVKTITAANRGEKSVATVQLAHIESMYSNSRGSRVDAPLGTITGGGGGHHAVVGATMVQMGYGEREGQAPRALDIEAPLGTVVASGAKHAVVGAFLARHNGSGDRWDASIGTACDEPVPTVTGKDTKAVVSSSLSPESSLTPEQLAGAHRVYAFMIRFYKSGGQWSACDEPLTTITTKGRMGLVTVTIAGETWVIVDIAMRMLTPRELARAQGFPDSYVLTGSKTEQIARIGNSVCPPVGRAVVAAQFGLYDPNADVRMAA